MPAPYEVSSYCSKFSFFSNLACLRNVLASFDASKLRWFAMVIRSVSSFSAYEKAVWPSLIPSTSIIFNTGWKPLLNMQADVLHAISTTFIPLKRCLGAIFQTQLLKLSLLFWVWPPKHLSSSSALVRSSYMGLSRFWASSARAWRCLYKKKNNRVQNKKQLLHLTIAERED